MPSAPQPSLGRGARDRILAAARELFRDPGINATGISELVARARVSRRTLYQHFASKDELIVAYLRDAAADPAAAPQRVLDREDLTPRARLLEMFGELGAGPRPLRGDPFIAAAVEIADPGHPARRVVAARQAGLAERFGELARAAGARDPDRVGARLAVLYVGAAAAVVAGAGAPGAGAGDQAIDDATAVARMVLAQAID